MAQERILSYEQFAAIGVSEKKNDIHCVTHWSRYDNTWDGVLFSDLFDEFGVKASATHVMFHCYGGYTANVPIADIRADDHAMLALAHDGRPLDANVRGSGTSRDSVAVLLEVGEVGRRDRVPLEGRARVLGDVRIPHARTIRGAKSATADSVTLVNGRPLKNS